MLFADAVRFLESRIDYEKRLISGQERPFKLDRMRAFLSLLGDPQDDLCVIHVAGTKGKGSTACFIASILDQAGFKTGFYTSPHLESVRERIRIFNGGPRQDVFYASISEEDFARLVTQLVPQIERLQTDSPGLGDLTYFEILTAMAFVYFRDEKTDFAVIETGLGGRLDATNTAPSLVSVITSIGYDHQDVLGFSLSEIAYEKAGIIKPFNRKNPQGQPIVVSAAQEKEVSLVIKHRVQSQKAVLLLEGRDFAWKKMSADLLGQEFYYEGLDRSLTRFRTRMLGEHQLVNASLALACCQMLVLLGFEISRENLTAGIEAAYWPGRMEIFQRDPLLILDGAHNKDSVRCLSGFIQKELNGMRRWLLFGASRDKDIQGMVGSLENTVDEIILTRADHPRSADPVRQIKPFFKKKNPVVVPVIQEAVEFLRSRLEPQEAAVVTGSLFLVGSVRALWQRKP